MKLPSYATIYNLGHRAVADLLKGPVLVEEKVDGSQVSFGLLEDGLHIRSKGAEIVPDAPEKMFTKAVETIKTLDLHPNWIYRGEFLSKTKHNTLTYDRVPKGNIIIFDINTAEETYLDFEAKAEEAERIGLETVPALAFSPPEKISLEDLKALLDTVSILGGQKIEGVVIKPLNYDLFGPDKKVLMGKHVSEAFKEIHQGEWKKSNPSSGDIIQQIVDAYRTPARWNKAIQHLTEAGALEGSPRDIGALIKEVPLDIEKEDAEEIKEALWNFAWPKIRRGVTAGLPEHYKERLLENQFNEAPN